MQKQRLLMTSLSVALIFSSAPKVTLAGSGSDKGDRPVRLYATAMRGPIGRITSSGGGEINGRLSGDDQNIWSGDLIRASGGSVRVMLDEIGQVTVNRGGAARLATARGLVEEGQGRILIASMIVGAAEVRLDGGAGAYVEAGGVAFTASAGSSFRVGVREGRAEMESLKGSVSQTQAPQPKYIIRPAPGMGSDISVKSRATRQVQFQVTDEHGKMLPDVPVVLLLAGSGGQLSGGAAAGASITVTTNAQGIATASFTAGPTAAASSVTATVAGTSVSATVGVATTAAGIVAGTTLGVVVGVAAAGAATATVVAVKKAKDNNTSDPITAGRPNITPKP